jgi:arabinofuranan 3-O-arabinosyltransferase
MSAQELAPARVPMTPRRLVFVIGLSFALGYVVVLLGAIFGGQWLYDPQGRPIANDFVNVWAAGRLAFDGHPALAYDWVVHKSMEIRAVGHAFDNYYGWHYPPVFLLVAAPLAVLPFTVSAVAWLALTLSGFAAAMRSILRDNAGIAVALGFPAALWNVTAGQNGFLTAALIGAMLLLLEKRPILAGICLGLLSYKPHFGLLFPVALIAAGHWRALASAAVTTLILIALSCLTFGIESWAAFFAAMPKLNAAVLTQGLAEFGRLQSVFGLVRAQGGGEIFAWIAQGAVSVGCIAATFALWRCRAAYELKAAGLVTLALIATPYLYIYDFTLLAVAAAFLLRYALARGILVIDAVVFACAYGLLLAYPFVKTQVGLAAALLFVILTAWHIMKPASAPAA